MARKSELDAAMDKVRAEIAGLHKILDYLAESKTAPKPARERKVRRPKPTPIDKDKAGNF